MCCTKSLPQAIKREIQEYLHAEKGDGSFVEKARAGIPGKNLWRRGVSELSLVYMYGGLNLLAS